MADLPAFVADTTPTLQQLIDYFVDSLFDVQKVGRLQNVMRNAHAEGATIAKGADFELFKEIGNAPEALLKIAERTVGLIAAPLLAQLVAHMLGIDVPSEALREGIKGGQGSAIGRAVTDTVLAGVTPHTTTIEPGDEGARRFMTMLSTLTLNTWFEGVILDEVLQAVPGIGSVESIADLGKQLIDSMGLSRLMRVALRPLAQIGIATPLEWKLHSQFRPTLLGDSTLARQIARGRGDEEQWREQFRRRGLSDANIDAILNEQRKFLGIGDVRELVISGEWAHGQGLQHLQEQGYDQAAAELALRVEGVKRIATQDRALIDAALTAYTDSRIDRIEFARYLGSFQMPASEQAFALELGDARRQLRVKRLTGAEAAECVVLGILGFRDYRDALANEGYHDEAIYALELKLRHTVDRTRSIAQHRSEQDAEHAAAKKAAAEKAAARETEIAARHALARRGSIPELKAAVERGLIPIARYEEVLAAHYDADTVQILVSLVEEARQQFLAREQKAADAAKRAEDKHLGIAQLEQAVLDNVIDVGRVRMGLEGRGLSPDDVNILIATITQRKHDHDVALAKRAAADAKAKSKGVNLTTFEALVRAGHRTLAQFDSLLVSLGEDDVARASIEELLQIHIAADQHAAQVKADAAAKLAARGLSLDQFRRAVILGAKSVDDYGRFLLEQKFTTDAQSVLVAEVRDAVAQAHAAQQRRQQAERAKGARTPPLATVAKAARLGLITLDAYQARLVQDGYTPEDVTIELDLLLTEIADVQRRRDEGGAAAASVASEVQATLAAAAGLRTQIATTATGRALSLAKLEQAVTDGLLTVEGYITEVEQQGFDADDAELLGALLTHKLAASGGPPAPTSGKTSRKKKAAAPPATTG